MQLGQRGADRQLGGLVRAFGLHAGHGHAGAHHQLCRLGLGVRRQAAIGTLHHEHILGRLAVFGWRGQGPAQVGAAQKAAVARVAGLVDQQVRGIAPGRLARRLHGGRAGLGEKARVMARLVQDDADQRHGQGQVAGRLDGQPAVAAARSQAGRGRQHGRDHHVAETVVLARAGLGQFAALALEGVAGLRGRRADEQPEAGMAPVRLAVRHAGQVAQGRCRTHAKALAAVGAVVADVHGAEGRPRKAAQQLGAAFVGGVGHQQLVGARAELGVVGVQRRPGVPDGAQALDLAFAEQVAALADFLHQLLEGNALPATAAARAHALERGEHAVRRTLVLQHGRAARAGRGPALQAQLLAQFGVDLAHGFFHGGRARGGQRVVGVACHAQDAVAGGIDTHAHAALRPAAQAAGGADHLAGLGGERARGRVDAELRRQRIAARGAGRGRARGACDQALGTARQCFTVAGRKGGQPTGGESAAQQQAAAGGLGIQGIFGSLGEFLLVGHERLSVAQPAGGGPRSVNG